MNTKAINKLSLVKAKERSGDIAIHSFYTVGHAKKYFSKMGANFEVKNYLTFKSGEIYIGESDIRSAEQVLHKKKGGLAKFAGKMTLNFLSIANEYKRFLVNAKKTDPLTLSKAKFADLYSKFLELNYSLVPYSFAISIIFEKIATDIIRQQIENLPSIIVAKKRNLTTQEYAERLKLALRYKKDKNTSLQNHIRKYEWLKYYSITDSPLGVDELREEVSKLSKRLTLVSDIETQSKEGGQKQKEFEKTIKKLRLPRNLRSLINILQKNIWVRTFRRELMSYGFFVMTPFHKEIAKRMDVPFAKLANLASWEIDKFLRTGQKVSTGELQKRDNNFLIAKINSENFIVSGSQVDKIQIKTQKILSTNEIKGSVVYPGKVSGIVSVVRNKQDMNRFSKGNILVAHTVTTWMTPVVEKCTGIITDAGGILSHTAIIAREFRIPCLINTKSATTLLKTGDKVIIDTKQEKIIVNK